MIGGSVFGEMGEEGKSGRIKERGEASGEAGGSLGMPETEKRPAGRGKGGRVGGREG